MTYFTIPMMFYACLQFPMPSEPLSDVVIDGFNFEQPVSIVVDNDSKVTVRNFNFNVARFSSCTPIVSHNRSWGIVEDGTFNGGYAIEAHENRPTAVEFGPEINP